MTRLGIGIITYNRLAYLQELVEQLLLYTRSPFELIVADDGSTDGTVEWCRARGIRVITGQNRGVAWNKNRALYYFMTRTECDPILLLEDDVRVWEPHWEGEWITVARGWHHVNWSHAQQEELLAGTGTPHEPWRTSNFGGACTITTRPALERVGYLNTQFQGYGVEHVNWTWRFARVYGAEWGGPPETVPCFTAHIGVLWERSHYNPQQMQANQRQHEAYMQDPRNFYDPWSTPEEAAELAAEIAAVEPETAPLRYLPTPELPALRPEESPLSEECLYPERWHRLDSMSCELEVLEFLQALVVVQKPQVVVETGAYLGWSAYYLGRGVARNGFGEVHSCDRDAHLAEIAQERCAGLPVTVHPCPSQSLEIPRPIDLLFLDCGARLEALERFWPQLTRRALVVMHDTTVVHPELGAALDDWQAEGRLDRIHFPTPRGLTLVRKRS
jgi:predicted O-methyltransferase YrrM